MHRTYTSFSQGTKPPLRVSIRLPPAAEVQANGEAGSDLVLDVYGVSDPMEEVARGLPVVWHSFANEPYLRSNLFQMVKYMRK